MKKEEKKGISLVTRIFFLLMIVICLQGALSFYTILFTDIATTVESYSYNMFTRTVENRKGNLESFMTAGWSNISEVSSTLSLSYQEMIGDKDSLTEKEKVTFLEENTEILIQMITMTGTTGGFLILDDGEDMAYSYSSVYLKSYDNVNQVGNSDNLMLARGPAEVSKKFGFSLVSNWSYGFTLTEDTYPILSRPLQATELTTHLEYLAYWHISTDITNDKLRVLTCSIPILDANDQAIGVVGIELSQEYLYKFLPEAEFGNYGSYGYILGTMSPEEEMLPQIINSATQIPLLAVDTVQELYPLPLEHHVLDLVTSWFPVGEENICVYGNFLNLYPNNSPYESQEIWIMGLVDHKNITEFTDAFWRVIASMLAVSLCAGIFVSYLVGRKVAEPILHLSKAVASYGGQEKMTFDKTGVNEIDDLSRVIGQMQENILQSANRTDKILELLNIGVGSFEYTLGSSTVTVSTALYKMLNLPEEKTVSSEEFFAKLRELKSHPLPDVAHTYSVVGEETQYLKVEEFTQGNVLLGVIQDSTKDVEDLLILNYERNYDLLTGIFNRRAFHQHVEELFQQGNLQVAGFVLFDLDNLKYVNDTFGHDSGDVYIKTAATTIASVLQNYGVVGRMSGDEFYAFLCGFESKEQVLNLLGQLYQQFAQEPIAMPNGELFQIRVSGGIAWYGDDSQDLEELKKYADFAMYKGKHTVKGELRQFDMNMYLEESFMLSGKAELNRILDLELMHFVFQPILDVKTGKLYAYEALMRPDSEILAAPLKLLQLASLEGKLAKVEKVAIFRTLALFKEMQDQFQGAKLFINSIPNENLKPEDYAQLREEYSDILPQVVIEIAEQEQQGESVILDKINQLRDLGVDITLDDYGSGYANDMDLIVMKPNLVKIDRSLISNVHVDPSRQTIVHKIITLCKEKNITVVGEGIETEQELEYLIHAGIELAQGYYISRPMATPTFHNEDMERKCLDIQQRLSKK